MQPISSKKIDKLREVNAQLQSLIIELETRVFIENVQEMKIREVKNETPVVFSNPKQ